METKKLTCCDLMVGDYMRYKDGTIVRMSFIAAACGYHSPHFDPDVMCNPTSLHNGVNAYESQKLTGFTQVKGRRRLSKKKRKQLKTKKQ